MFVTRSCKAMFGAEARSRNQKKLTVTEKEKEALVAKVSLFEKEQKRLRASAAAPGTDLSSSVAYGAFCFACAYAPCVGRGSSPESRQQRETSEQAMTVLLELLLLSGVDLQACNLSSYASKVPHHVTSFVAY